MAKKKPREPSESTNPPSPTDSHSGSAGDPNEETMRVDGDDSIHHVDGLDSDSEADPIPHPSDSTGTPAKEKAPSSNDSDSENGIASDESVDMDRTVGNTDATVRMDITLEDVSSPINAGDKTVDSVAVDQTVAWSGDEMPPQVSVRSGKGHATVKEGASDQTVDDRGPSQNPTMAMSGSIMASKNTAMTVNPRDLSERDAKLWNSEVGQNDELPSSLPPAIDRTFSDKQFDRLRKCDVAERKTDPDVSADYQLLGKLGQGGMGDVFVARQGSLDRLLALKLIRPLTGKKRAQLARTGKLESVEEERRQQFLSEAIVTGDLDHPNIVPIHDVALTSNDELFYSMKRVDGTPWSDVIGDMSRDENLEILLKAADAVGFAHTRGVVHRDIKPENIMLGPFGVVMVMDWGLALPTSQYEKLDSIFSTSGLGGTPAFMAPEMATGPVERIGPASDIYLLGATLYMIVTGFAPHHGKNVTECLRAVRSNAIRSVPPERQSELLEIALKAMATDPEDRYPDVESFQQAIRDYRSHAESISLAARAWEDVQRGQRDGSYSDLSRAAFRFEESIKLWPGNKRAVAGHAEAIQVHAEAALANGDFDLGLSLLDEHNEEHRGLIESLRAAQHERESRQSRLAVMRKVAVAMLAIILVGTSVAVVVVNNERRVAEQARDDATQARDDEEIAKLAAIAAQEQEEFAKNDALAAASRELAAKQEALEARDQEEAAKKEAVQSAENERIAKQDALLAAELEKAAKLQAEQRKIEAEQARDAAKTAQVEAESARRRAEYEQYVSMIGLAKARLERNEADGAREILDSIRSSPEFRKYVDRWEWRWLWHQANQSASVERTGAAVVDLALDSAGRQAAIALSDGNVELQTISDDGQLVSRRRIDESSLLNFQATSVAFAPRDELLAIGTSSGTILMMAPDGSRLRVMDRHRDRVNDLQFSKDGTLFSASSDRTVRLWDPVSGIELTDKQACYHLSAVQQIAVAGSGNSMRMAAAISDGVTGQVAIWQISRTGQRIALERTGTMTAHRSPVRSVAISEDGQQVASGDLEGSVLLWSPADSKPIDYAGTIAKALANLDASNDSTSVATNGQPNDLSFSALIDTRSDSPRLVSTSPDAPRRRAAHDDVVKSIRFSRDARQLLTASDDYTLKVWDLQSQRVAQTFKGHGGWVIGAEFIDSEFDGAEFNGGRADGIVSASNDATVRTWRPDQYVGAFVSHRLDRDAAQPPLLRRQAHQDEILSARFSRDGRQAVTASHDHTARVMAIDPQTLAFREVVKLQDKLLAEGTSYVAMSIQLDRQHRRLFIGNADTTIRIWDLDRATQLQEANGTGLNASFAVSADGRYLLTGSSQGDAKALLWQLDPELDSPPIIEHRLGEHEQAVTAFAISPDAKYLFTGDRGGFGILWDRISGQRQGAPIDAAQGFRINAASFSIDGAQLLIAADDQQLTTIDLESREVVARLSHDGFVTRLEVSDDGQYAATVSEMSSPDRLTNVATLWHLPSGRGFPVDQTSQQRGQDAVTAQGRSQTITSARFDPTSQTLVVSRSSGDGNTSMTRLFDIPQVMQSSGDRSIIPAQTFETPPVLGTVQDVMVIDESNLLTMNKNGAFLWDLSTERLTKSYRAHAALTEAAFSENGEFVATASRSVKIWDAKTGKSLAKLESPRPIRSVQFAPVAVGPHEMVIATGGDDGVARLWSWDASQSRIDLLREFENDSDGALPRTIRRLRFSPNADWLLIVGDRGLAEVVSVNEPTKVISLPISPINLTSGAFSDDGRCVAVAGDDKRARVYVLPDQDEVAVANQSPREAVMLIGHADIIHDVVFLGTLQEGLRVMTASADDTARIFDPRLDAEGISQGAAREILSLRQHSGDVTSVDVTDDGSLLMTAGRDGNVILWPAEPPPENLFEQ